MPLIRNPGRVAGLWYVLLVLLSPLRLMYISSTLIHNSNATTTARDIAAHQALFRLGIVSDLAVAIVLIFLTLALYKLFEGTSRYLAVQVILFGGVMPALLNFVTASLDSGALLLARGEAFMAAFTPAQNDALILLLLRLRSLQSTASELLWGVWLFPLALLVYRSGFLPRFLAWWLGANGVAYVTLCLVGEVAPVLSNKVFLASQPLLLGELAFVLWLVVRGARSPAPTPHYAQ